MGLGHRPGSAGNVALSLTQMKGLRTKQGAKKDLERQRGKDIMYVGQVPAVLSEAQALALDMATSWQDGACPHSHVLHHTPTHQRAPGNHTKACESTPLGPGLGPHS